MPPGTGLPSRQQGRVLTQVSQTIQPVRGTGQVFEQLAYTAAQMRDRLEKEAAAAQAAYIADIELTADRASIDLRDQHAYDPEGFEAAWKAYGASVIENAPSEYRHHIEDTLLSIGNSKYGRIIDERREQQRRNTRDSLEALVGLKMERATALGRSGLGNSPEQVEALQGMNSALDLLAQGGHIGQMEADVRSVQMTSAVMAESMLPEIMQVFNRRGIRGATEAINSLIDDPRLSISREYRDSLRNRLLSRVNQLDAIGRADLERAERSEKIAESRLRREQRQNTNDLGASVLRGEMDEVDIQAALSSGSISFQDALTIRGALHDVRRPGQEFDALMLANAIDNGAASEQDVIVAAGSGRIHRDDGISLLDRVRENRENNGMFSSEPYRANLNILRNALRGDAGDFAAYDPERAARIDAAEDEFRQRILKQPDITPQGIEGVRRELAEKYVPGDGSSAPTSITPWMILRSGRVDRGQTEAVLRQMFDAEYITKEELGKRLRRLDNRITFEEKALR